MKKLIVMSLFLLGCLTQKAVSRGGDAFVGGLAGGTFGGLLGGAISRSSSPERVVVREDGSGRDALRAVDRLEDAVRQDLRMLKDRIDRNHDALEKIDRNFEEVKLNTSDLATLKSESEALKQKVGALEKKILLLEQRTEERFKKLEQQVGGPGLPEEAEPIR